MTLPSDRSIADVLRDIVANVQHIIRAEVRLAKIETRDELLKMKRSAMFFGAAGLLGTLAVGVLLLAAVYALALVMPSWAAALIVAVVTGIVAAICVGTGVKNLKQVTLPPPKTVATIQENLQWAKTQTK
jgi:uncharacterized membrane protein YqjE